MNSDKGLLKKLIYSINKSKYCLLLKFIEN